MSLLPLSKDSPAANTLARLQDIPALRQLLMLLMLAGAVALGLWIFFWSQRPDFVPLSANMDAKATAEASEVLRAAEIPFRLDPNTGALTVPGDQIQQARMKLATAGLSDSAPVGFEIMERDPGFGVSQFVENARYQHALEIELARTIKTLRPVREARVHLAIPKPSAFSRQRDPAGASVVLDLHPGRRLDPNQIDAMVHLIASSVPDLAPERVTVVDQQGRMLSTPDPNSEAALSAAQFEQVQRQESALTQRIQTLLEPLAGAGRVSAQVSVDMDFSVTEQAREVFTPDPAKLRSEQTAESSNSTPPVQGIPGSASNTPTAPAAAGKPATPSAATETAAATPTQTSRTATRNFEMDRTLSHMRQPAGSIRRVTAAVLVDYVPRAGKNGKWVPQPLDADTLKRVEALVKEAVGFDGNRGDSVSVMNAPFVRQPTEPIDTSVPLWENPLLRDIGRALLGALAVLALLFGVLRPTLKQLLGPKQHLVPSPGNAPVVYADIDHETDPEPAPIALASSHYEDRLRVARTAASNDSKRVAQVVKDWVGVDG